MKKIPSLFIRDYDGNRQVINKVVPGCEWVQKGEGQAYRKYDGTSCMVKDGELYKRYDVKRGRKAPEIGIPCEPKPNEHTGHWPWWVPVGDGPEDKYHNRTFNILMSLLGEVEDGTYELCGPKVNGNNDGFTDHCLVDHKYRFRMNVPVDFEGLKEWFKTEPIEGIVWHHPDGRMCKIKRRDFGYKWPIK